MKNSMEVPQKMKNRTTIDPTVSLLDIYLVVRSLSCVWPFATPRTAGCQACLSFTVSQSWLRLMSIESMMPSNHLILCHPLFLLPSIFPSIRVFSNESVPHIRWPKYWSFSLSISPSNEYSGLISFRIDWYIFLGSKITADGDCSHEIKRHVILSRSALE